jgi:hypothetical protein
MGEAIGPDRLLTGHRPGGAAVWTYWISHKSHGPSPAGTMFFPCSMQDDFSRHIAGLSRRLRCSGTVGHFPGVLEASGAEISSPLVVLPACATVAIPGCLPPLSSASAWPPRRFWKESERGVRLRSTDHVAAEVTRSHTLMYLPKPGGHVAAVAEGGTATGRWTLRIGREPGRASATHFAFAFCGTLLDLESHRLFAFGMDVWSR